MKKYKVLDLFAGAGGLSLGFFWAGFEIIGAVDNMEESCTTFKKNHKNSTVICDDIKKITPEKLSRKIGNNIDIILGGPPCQGLSLAGKRLADDPRNELFLDFVKYVDYFKPSAFLMENVPGLLSIKNGETHRAILKAFKDIGYNNFYDHKPTVLLAANYGVPQLRNRLFYLGTKGKTPINFPPKQTHFPQTKTDNISIFDHSELSYITVEQAIGDLPSLKSGGGAEEMDYTKAPSSDYQKLMRKDSKKIYNHVAPNHTRQLNKMIKNTKSGGSVDPNYSDSRRWDKDQPSFTIKALGAGGGSTNRRAFHYQDLRGSTVRENARIQSFPDSYRFYGSKTMQMTQVGNAVPPILALRIAETIRDGLDQNKII